MLLLVAWMDRLFLLMVRLIWYGDGLSALTGSFLMTVFSANIFRAAVYKRMQDEWKLEGDHITLLRTALGLVDTALGLVDTDPMTDEQNRLCELMAGEHGYAIFKMLLARNGVIDEH